MGAESCGRQWTRRVHYPGTIEKRRLRVEVLAHFPCVNRMPVMGVESFLIFSGAYLAPQEPYKVGGFRAVNVADPRPERLLSEARDGIGQALGALLDLYRNYLKLLARRQMEERLRGNVDPSDLVQETMLEAQRDFRQFRGIKEPELMSWLRKLLAHNAADVIRRYLVTRQRNVRFEGELCGELDRSSQAMDRAITASDTSPSQRYARRERAILVADALERLPADYREVLVLRRIEGLSLREVAKRMNRTVDSVKNVWARAVPRFRRFLGESV